MQEPTLLLVEDEPIIASDLQCELESMGYRVLLAADEREALLLCDRYLPHMAIINFRFKNQSDGMSLARQLRIRCFSKVVFITGARPQDLEASKHYYAGHEVLYKPFTKLQLFNFLLAISGAKG